MSAPMDLLLATGNEGKVVELKTLLAELPVRLHTLRAFPKAPEVVEDRSTLEGNARKKAETLASFTDLPALADDTGLEVEALGGRPGVHTARFAGEEATSADNCRKLLSVMEDEAERGAQFRTVVALALPDGDTHCFEGICRGRITRAERGAGGFGYDALFVPADQPGGAAQTFAEMSTEAKNAISHRRRALDELRTHLDEHFTEAGKEESASR